MSASVMFVDDAGKRRVRGYYDRFRERLGFATEPRSFETSFGRTHALVTGPEDGASLVVTHGALASSAHVLPELGPLVERRRVYALDVIGQSVMSEDRRIELGDASYGRWVSEAADALGLDRFDLVGASWGGFVATRAASTLGDRVRRLVLVVPAGIVAGSAWKGFVRMGWPLMMYRAFPSEARLERLVEPLFTTRDELWTSYFGEAVRAYRLDMRIPPLLEPRDLEGLTAPVLVVAAEEDLSFPGSALAARAEALFPDVEVELVEGAKHSTPMTPEFRRWLGERMQRFFEAHPR
jgi:pimeloyl-ACP methyl ester carboxylesterase